MSNVRLIQLGYKYEMPEAVEVKGKEWVSYGADNDFYNELLRLKDSPTNGALINSITDLIYGRGLKAVDASKNPEGWASFLSIVSEETLRCLTDDFYTLGEGYLQCIWDKTHTKVVEVYHSPTQNYRPEKCNEEGDIEAYYYHDDWAKMKRSEKPIRIPAFGTSREGIEVLCIKPYRSGYFYFAPVEYMSGLQYAEAEISIANFHVNNIKNKFSANHIINFNNGVPEEDEQDRIESKIKSKFSGEDGDALVVAFNNSAEEAANIETVQINNPHEQYSFMAEECTRKIMVSHRVVSPLLFGLPTNGGLGSNADEIKMASQLFDNTVINPLQRVVIDGLDKIASANGLSFNLYFETLQPLDFTEIEVEDVAEEVVEEKVGVELSAELDDFLLSLGEQEETEGWELIYEGDDYEDDGWNLEYAIRQVNEEEAEMRESILSKVVNLVSTGSARPNATSEWDERTKDFIVKVRYEYSPRKTKASSRQFCQKMVNAAKLYRREDIAQMSSKPVNAGWGANGASTYDIFLYKGGGDCHHRWVRKIYARTDNNDKIDVKSPRAQSLITSYRDATSSGYSKGADPDYNKAKKRPKDMPNNGFLKPRG